MGLGCRTRRDASAWAVAILATLSGCHAMPVGGFAPAPNHPTSTLGSASRAALLPATVAMDPPSEMSAIEPVPTPFKSLTPAEPARDPLPMAPTPLLDAALMRARGLDEVAPPSKDKPPVPSIMPDLPPGTTPEPTTLLPPGPPFAIDLPVVSNPPPASHPQPQAPAPSPSAEVVKEAETSRPEDVWREGVRKLASIARAKLEQSPTNGTLPPSPWGLKSQVVAWLAEPDLDPDLGHRETDGVRAVLRALDASSGESPRRGDEVRSAVLVLEDKAPFELNDLRFCRNVTGFGDFETFDPASFKAGQPVVLYYEVDGLRFEQTSAGFRTRIAAQVEVFRDGGGAPLSIRLLENAEETCRRRRRDYYVGCKLQLPTNLAPGDYRIRLTAKDLNSDRSASREVGFSIVKD